MRARSRDLLPLVLVLAVAGCIKLDEWSKYNKDPGQPCESADECSSCPDSEDPTCSGPPGDTGICQAGVCRMTRGEIGLDCSGETPDSCDYHFCVYKSAAEKGICAKDCGTDGTCPADTVCTQVTTGSGGTAHWCFQTCSDSTDCDTNASCQSGAGMICFPN